MIDNGNGLPVAGGLPPVPAGEAAQYTISGFELNEQVLMQLAGQLFNALAMVRLGQVQFTPQGVETPEEFALRLASGAEMAVSMMLKHEQEALALYAGAVVRMVADVAVKTTRYAIEPVDKPLIVVPGR